MSDRGSSDPAIVDRRLAPVGEITGLFGIPVTMTIAILKYRLYDIDRIISRTLAYAIITGVLVSLYAGLVLLARSEALEPPTC